MQKFSGVCNSETEDNELSQSPATNAIVYSVNHSWSDSIDSPITLTTVQSQVTPSTPSPTHSNNINNASTPPTTFMSWYTPPEQAYQLTHHHHHYQPLEYVPLSMTQPQHDYIHSEIHKSGTSPTREDTNEYECGIEQRLFPKNNNSDDICLIKDL